MAVAIRFFPTTHDQTQLGRAKVADSWGSVLAEVVPLALIIAASPLSVIPAVLVLHTPRPKLAGLAFLAGWTGPRRGHPGCASRSARRSSCSGSGSGSLATARRTRQPGCGR